MPRRSALACAPARAAVLLGLLASAAGWSARGRVSRPASAMGARAPRARVAALDSKLVTVGDHGRVDTFGQSTYGDLVITSEDAEPLSDVEVAELFERIMPSIPQLPTGEAVPLDTAGPTGASERTDYDTRGVYCSRTLNMRSIKCIGYDMDYTLVQYNVHTWEAAAYRYAKEALGRKGFPVENLTFTPELVVRGTVLDKELGNFVQVDRFGYVRRAMHGTRRLSRQELHTAYGRLVVDLRQTGRWEFTNTLFSISEGVLYAQLVEKLDDGTLFTEARPPFNESKCATYQQLAAATSKALFKAHCTSALKEEVLADKRRFIRRDPNLPLTLMDQKDAGKKLVLVTNSDWRYTNPVMSYICDEYLPAGMSWLDLFDAVIVSARKPAFFSESMPLYEVVDRENGLMQERFKLETGKVYCGGHAHMVERLFHCEKDELLYIGDHIYTDVNMVKATMRWRTALVVQELEAEVAALADGREEREQLQRLLRHKDILSNGMNHVRTEFVRFEQGRPSSLFSEANADELSVLMQRLLRTMSDVDVRIDELMRNEGAHLNPHWGYMSRAGHADKSHLMRQIEKYADIYMSRVSNMLKYTPYMYYRAHYQSLAHDQLAQDAEPVDDRIIRSSHLLEAAAGAAPPAPPAPRALEPSVSAPRAPPPATASNGAAAAPPHEQSARAESSGSDGGDYDYEEEAATQLADQGS